MPQPFTIYVTQSAHTDIGYTHPQEQIKRMYLDYYERVLELCRQTEHDPQPYRYKWVCETAWQVRHFLEHRPEREEEFLRFVRAGQIEITAAYLHFTDLIDQDGYARSLEWVVNYCRAHSLPLKVAMHADINGWPWGAADALAYQGIRYFISHVHLDSGTDPLGKRGSVHYYWAMPQVIGGSLRPDVDIRVPQAFWWQGPAGGRVLHFLNEHYHLGNFLGLSANQGFADVKRTSHYYELDRQTAGELYAVAEREVPRYIERLRQAGYLYNSLVINAAGFFTDNGAPDHRWCEVIRQWNESHSDIVLRTATLSEWFEALEQETAGQDLPTYAVAWPDHWAHGLGSETAVIALARQSQRRRGAVESLVKASGSETAAQFFDQALEEERLALEHTFDAWCTTFRPGSPLNAFQQVAKQLTFYRTAAFLDEAVDTALRAIEPQRPSPPSLFVFCNESPPQVRLVHFDAVDYNLDPAQHMLVDEDGSAYPFQLDDPAVPSFVAALPLSPGLNCYQRVDHAAVSPDRPPVENTAVLSSPAWQVEVDPRTGGLARLFETGSGREWAAPGQDYAFGQIVHEAITHPLGRQACGNLARMIALGAASEELRAQATGEPIFRRSTLQMEPGVQFEAGPVFDTLRLAGSFEAAGSECGAGRVQVSWRVYHELPVVELNLEWDKRWSDLPEAAYVVFPFQAPGAQLALETGGGFFIPGSHDPGGQLPGTSSSYYTVQRAARIRPAAGPSLFWLPLDAPLVLTNQVAYNRWETDPYEWNGLLASMPVNHYWHTNFPASQHGILKLRYRLAAQHGWPDEQAALQAAMPVEVHGWR